LVAPGAASPLFEEWLDRLLRHNMRIASRSKCCATKIFSIASVCCWSVSRDEFVESMPSVFVMPSTLLMFEALVVSQDIGRCRPFERISTALRGEVLCLFHRNPS